MNKVFKLHLTKVEFWSKFHSKNRNITYEMDMLAKKTQLIIKIANM